MPANWFAGLRKKEESQKLHVGVQRRGRRFWPKGHQAKAQHIKSMSVQSHELSGQAVHSNGRSQDCGLSVRDFACSLQGGCVSDHLILVSPGPETHQIEKTGPKRFCYSPLHCGSQHLPLFYESSTLWQQWQFKWSLFPMAFLLAKTSLCLTIQLGFVLTL